MLRILSPLAVAAALMTGLPAGAADQTAPPAGEVALPSITVVAVARRELTDRVFASGMVQPVETVQVAPLIDGQAIETLEADVGDVVKAGQVLATLSESSLALSRSQAVASRASAEAAIAQANAQLVDAQATRDEAVRVRDRTRQLADQGAATRAAVDTSTAAATSAEARVNVAVQSLAAAKAQVDVIDAQIADIDLRLSRTKVKAPVDGVITERRAMIGSIAAMAGTPMFTMIRDGALELRAQVAEQDLLRLQVGQHADIALVGGGAGTVSGTVRLVEPVVDEATRLGTVRITFDDSAQVRWGMFGDASIVVARREALSIPLSAVGGVIGKEQVMKVEGETVHAVTVRTGIRDGGHVEVPEGLNVGDTVVAKAGAFVRDGDRINPVPIDGTETAASN